MKIKRQDAEGESRLIITSHLLELVKVDRLVDEILCGAPRVRAYRSGFLFMTTVIVGEPVWIMCAEVVLGAAGFEVMVEGGAA
ncbi:hypothetical protein M8A54_000369 [Salmonella enterica]|nr:hypothetical protein [Salmonella enterica]